MSERIYACLLRLYPSRFRSDYGAEALQLFRDRARHETGFVSALRLWLDLFSDLASSVPSAYRAFPAATASYSSPGSPAFLTLGGDTPGFGSFFYATVSSLLVYTAVLFLLAHSGLPSSIHSSDTSPSSSISRGYSGAAARVSPSSASAASTHPEMTAQQTPSVRLTYSPLPPASGSTVSFTATVVGDGGKPAPTGTVRFFDGVFPLNAGWLNNGTVTVTGKLPNLATHFFSAVYSGDGTYRPASSYWKASEVNKVSAVRSTAPAVATGGPSAHRLLSQTVAAPAVAQPGQEKPLTFEVVSIHEDKSGTGVQRTMENGPTPDGYRLRGGPLLTVIQAAFLPSDGALSFRPNRISGLPQWAYSIPYSIDAKIYEADLPQWKDSTLRPVMMRTMLQAMLADRFKLAIHRENRVVPVYELGVRRKGTKLKPYDGATLAEIQHQHPGARMLAGGVIAAPGPNPGQQSFFGVTMSELGTLLSNLAGRPILDKTGLTGRYDVSYQIDLRPPPQEDGTPAPVPPDFFSSQISTIVEDQLGLKLKPGNGAVEVLVIDHVQQPSEN